MTNSHQNINYLLKNWRNQNNYSNEHAAALLNTTNSEYILWENGCVQPDKGTISRIIELISSSNCACGRHFHSTEHKECAEISRQITAPFTPFENPSPRGLTGLCSPSMDTNSIAELTPPTGTAESDTSPICPAILARRSMIEAKQAYDALSDNADPTILQTAETVCRATENRLCEVRARSIPGLRAQIEELMNRFMLDEHETQPEATRMLFDNILAGLSGFGPRHEDAYRSDTTT